MRISDWSSDVCSSDLVAGPDFSQAAVDSTFPGWGAGFVAIALLFFVFTTVMAYYYMAETNIAYINRKVHRPWLILVLRLTIIGAVFLGVFRTTGGAWALGDVGVGLMAWLNLIAIVILQKPALAALRDYQRQRKRSEEHTSELQSLMRISYAVFCLTKK